jgi:hypothetical protein
MWLRKSRAASETASPAVRRLGFPGLGVVVHADRPGRRRRDLLGALLHVALGRAGERHVPDERAHELPAVQLAEEEVVVGIDPVDLRQQVGAAAVAVREVVHLEVERLAVSKVLRIACVRAVNMSSGPFTITR